MSAISIIVPIFNVEKYLERCINSILNQSFKDFELILIDDGSTDNCPYICDKFSNIDKRIKVFHKKNGGLSDARNYGLSKSTSEYIVFIDSDDWISNIYLETLYNISQKNKCDIVECDIIKTNTETNDYEIDINQLSYNVEIYQPKEALKLLIKDSIFHQYVWNKLYKRNTINDIIFRKGKTNEDEFWTYQIFGNANKIAKVDIPLYYYFERDNSIMRKKYNINRLDALDAKVERQEYISKNHPELSDLSQINLFESCIFQGQLSIKYLKNKDLEYAKTKISTIINLYKPSYKKIKNLPVKQKIWLISGKIDFWKTCKIKNLLRKGL